MKTLIQKTLFILLFFPFCSKLQGQSRMVKTYDAHEKNCNLRKIESKKNLLNNSLSGYYFEGFENTFPPSGWQIYDVLDTAATWVSSLAADVPSSYQGIQSAYCSYTYPTGTLGEDWLVAPRFSVVTGDSLSFRFKLEYHGYTPDSTFVIISTTDSSQSSFTSILDVFSEGTNYPADTISWVYKTYSLDAFAGQDIYIAFKNKNEFGDGVFIDNVEIGTRPGAEVGVSSIDIEQFLPVGIVQPKATIVNNGASPQSFEVIMNIGSVYSSSKLITVAPFNSNELTFDSWNSTPGEYKVNVYLSLPGDVNNSNDTLESKIKILESFENYGWSIHENLPLPTAYPVGGTINSTNGFQIFMVGGFNSNYSDKAYQFNSSNSSWNLLNPLLDATGLTGSAIVNGKLYVFGGINSNGILNSTQILDLASGNWTDGEPLPSPLYYFETATYKDSLIYLIGGYYDSNNSATNEVFIYDTYLNSWDFGSSKPGPAVGSPRGGIVGNKIVVAGGFDPVTGKRNGDTYVGEINEMIPTEITWTQVEDHPANVTSKSASAVSIDKNSSLVIFSGGVITNGPELTNATFAFDLTTNTWKIGPYKPSKLELSFMTPVVENDSLYMAVLGGGDGTFPSDKNEWLNLGPFSFTSDVKNFNLTENIQLYPNPSSDISYLDIKLPKSSDVKVSLTDLTGRTVLNICSDHLIQGDFKFPVQISELPAGLYFCKININGKDFTKKLIKI